MTSGQRKAHKYIWLVLTMVVTMFLFFIISNLSFSSVHEHAQEEQVVLQKEGNKVRILLNSPFRSSSSVVYGLTSEGNPGKPLGQLNGVGEYTFESEQNIKGIVIKDEIKGLEIYKSEF